MQQTTSPQPTRKHKEPVTDKKAGKKRKAEEQEVPSHKTKKPLFIGKGEDDVDLESLIPNVEERKPLENSMSVSRGASTHFHASSKIEYDRKCKRKPTEKHGRALVLKTVRQ